ncbi:MAG: sigma-54 dependent transcriptional regulator, partial [Pirellulales bacterium]|nr:sigma-54 dependent transcriptional regulator [Pirellulales bacterium]
MTTANRLQDESGKYKIVGTSLLTKRLRAEISRAAPFDSNVLVTGSSGSGKELVARTLHAQSARAEGLFIPVDCASLLGELMASQLFGHVEGAFTGASYSAMGCFRAADRGTIFLDEIGELELPLQARLLRTLQERVVTPVGSHEGIPVDVRIVAATNRNLQDEIAAGRFREDLYYRLNVVSIETPPLCARPEDIPELAESFLKELVAQGLPHRALSPGAMEAMQDYAWPGNV